ncbi:uncharacterized protein TRUGW13939_10488 [Talaromyces rugulosus]|uniref:Heterokaryon incompatibility domain-containing protein n=1 Tax=Talaromyces rugulosus TaxID=121627 RepID=A0A7H8RBC5_TALRU|nr:uncharacterized protein TRUGW13939_10488 [Talaromyces rugulosus]QKX63318.1 hypothetical protein TRUGW13939_10488 [Talaromyces rugulosus]
MTLFHPSLEEKKEKALRKAKKNLKKQYDGGKHKVPFGRKFERPRMDDRQREIRMIELEDGKGNYRKRVYRNPLGEKTSKHPDLDTYYSTTREIPRRLVVQATEAAMNEARNDPHPRYWRQTKINGRAPFLIRLAEFCWNPLGLLEADEIEESDDDDDDDDNIYGKKKSEEKKPVAIRHLCMRILNWITSAFCILSFAWIIQFVLAAQIAATPWSDDDSADPYKEYDNVHWSWPQHAINRLDQAPDNPEHQSEIGRLSIPRLLRVKTSGKWKTKETRYLHDKATRMLPEYVLLSFSRANFPGRSVAFFEEYFDRVADTILAQENKKREIEGKHRIEAYWVDTHCVSKETEQKTTEDINTICDAVRCAKKVYIVLPAINTYELETWGQRIWTMPEVLLAVGKIAYCTCSPDVEETGELNSEIHDVDLNEFYDSFWHDTRPTEKDDEDVVGLLVKHYSGSLKLTDLQLFTCAVQALARRFTSERGKENPKTIEGYTTTDVAYAAMGLMAYRITPNKADDNFQAIARLSLVNDSNLLLERLVSLWPHQTGETTEQKNLVIDKNAAGSVDIMRNIANRDQYSTYLWDIHPLCNVVGIADEKYTPAVILDQCRAIPIRWKGFPKMKYVQDFNKLGATLSQTIVFWGSSLVALGFALFTSALSLEFSLLPYKNYNNNNSNNAQIPSVKMYLVGSAVFFGCAWVISWLSPRAVRQLCHSGSAGISCHLVGFEGIQSLHDIETSIFGNCDGRFSYAPSSNLFSEPLRAKHIRMGKEPKEGVDELKRIAKSLCKSPRDRLFTIVDTGDLTVTVIAAERPPVVALICGREGGMLRALLCSWRFDNNCLYRESVVRMRSSLEDQTTPMDWLKVSLASQGDVSREIVKHRIDEKRKQYSGPSPQIPLSTVKPHVSINGL